MGAVPATITLWDAVRSQLCITRRNIICQQIFVEAAKYERKAVVRRETVIEVSFRLGSSMMFYQGNFLGISSFFDFIPTRTLLYRIPVIVLDECK